MKPYLIGYFAKRTLKRPNWLNSAGVDEICSVSNCISAGPTGWIDHWQHNEMWVYDTPELAFSVVPDALRDEFDLYGYQVFPIQFAQGQQQPLDLPQLQVKPLLSAFECLGFDVVSRSCGTSFECSPLSCNHMAMQVAVNRYCLLDNVGVAFQLAATLEASGCEPGPYLVLEVWRQK